MALALADLRPNLRTILQDIPAGGVYAYSDDVCDDLIKTVIQTGLGPGSVAVSGVTLDPEPANADARGLILFQAALIAIGGTTGFSWKTRSMSVTMKPMERKYTIDHLRRMIKRIEENGDPDGTGLNSGVFGIWSDCENYIYRLTTMEATY